MVDNSRKILGLPFEDPFNIPENCVVDFSNISFSENFLENITTAFIYLRNLDYTGDVDFSRLSYNQKCDVIKTYITRDIKDLSIKSLDYAIFKFFISGSEELTSRKFFTDEETKMFVDENRDICKEIYDFIISIPVFTMTLDKTGMIDQDVSEIEHTDVIPSSYECICNLLRYRFSDMIYISDGGKTKPKFYDKLFYYENGVLADIVKESIFSKIYSSILNISVGNVK